MYDVSCIICYNLHFKTQCRTAGYGSSSTKYGHKERVNILELASQQLILNKQLS